MPHDEKIKKVQEEIEWLERARNKLLQQVSIPIVVTRTGSFPEKNPAENPEIRARIEKLDGLIAERKVRLAQLHEEKLAQMEFANSTEVRGNAAGHETRQPLSTGVSETKQQGQPAIRELTSNGWSVKDASGTAVRQPKPKAAQQLRFEGLRAKKQNLEQHFHGLTNRQHDCASLKWEYGLSESEIARRLNLHHTTVHEHLDRAKERIDAARNSEKKQKASFNSQACLAPLLEALDQFRRMGLVSEPQCEWF